MALRGAIEVEAGGVSRGGRDKARPSEGNEKMEGHALSWPNLGVRAFFGTTVNGEPETEK